MKTNSKRLRNNIAIGFAILGQATANGGLAAVPVPLAAAPADAWHYADVADLYGAAPLVLKAKILSATALKAPPSADGSRRFYVEADVTALIRGNQAVLPRVAWLVDVPPDSRGKMPKLKNAEVLVAALPVAGRPGEVRLAARDAQQLWSAALESRVRALVTRIAAPDAAPAVTGIASAFHSPGTIPGEGETQIFLSTSTRAPISITVLTRPGTAKRWAFALGEIVDDAAAPPAPDTLEWYRLACSLPPTLPAAATAELGATDADAARQDYAFVVEALGRCARVRR